MLKNCTVWGLAIAAVGLAGSAWLSLGLELVPCPLCYYQRALIGGIAGLLALGLATPLRTTVWPAVLAGPLAAAGLIIAGFHVWLEASGKLECPPGMLGLGSAPLQSLLVYAALTAALVGAVLQQRVREEAALRGLTLATVLGVFLAGSLIVSAPPLPPTPTAPYDKPLNVCRPPYVGAVGSEAR